MSGKKPKRGEVWWVNFDPSKGGEMKKMRPAVIISNDISNKYVNRFQVVPLTSNTEKIYPGESLVFVDGKEGKTLSNQLATISEQRLDTKISNLTKEEMYDLEDALNVQLGL